MSRRNLTIYTYNTVPTELPPSRHKTTLLDTLDSHIDDLWDEDIRKQMQPIGHPSSKRFFIQQYHAVQLLQAKAALKGITSVSNGDVWMLMSALRRVAHRRGIAPRQLLHTVTLPQAAE